MEPSAVFMGVWGAIEEDNFALVPALIALSDVGQIETRQAVRRIRTDTADPPLVALAAVSWIAVIPDVDRNVLTLKMREKKKRTKSIR